MKKSLTFCLGLMLTLSYSFVSVHSSAQTISKGISNKILKLNGDDIIERLLSQRYDFNKKLIKSSVLNLAELPKAEYVFNRNAFSTVTLDGLEYTFDGNKIVGIKGLNLSDDALAQITDKLLLLDRVQYYYCEKANNEYYNEAKDIQAIKNIDRQFYSSLKTLLSTTHSIASFTKNENPSLNVETKIAKMARPNINKSVEYICAQPLTNLTAK